MQEECVHIKFPFVESMIDDTYNYDNEDIDNMKNEFNDWFSELTNENKRNDKYHNF